MIESKESITAKLCAFARAYDYTGRKECKRKCKA